MGFYLTRNALLGKLRKITKESCSQLLSLAVLRNISNFTTNADIFRAANREMGGVRK